MKNYKSPNNKLFAYESDGSQDHLIPNDYIAITKEEADIINKQITQEYNDARIKTEVSLEEKIALLQEEINALKLKV
jgi:tmRNA-binding protein